MSWRTEIDKVIKTLKSELSALKGHHNDLEQRFQRHVQPQVTRPRIKIEHNQINNTFEWEIYRVMSDPYGYHTQADRPFSEGRADSYQAAVDAVIYHEARLRLGLPNKPNGVTKNY